MLSAMCFRILWPETRALCVLRFRMPVTAVIIVYELTGMDHFVRRDGPPLSRLILIAGTKQM